MKLHLLFLALFILSLISFDSTEGSAIKCQFLGESGCEAYCASKQCATGKCKDELCICSSCKGHPEDQEFPIDLEE
ncbi:hypothetical protein WR25_10208 [Diploscapter pachys]|uniref:Invertebrate defensins family profile domain-containing protein n=1 Tax=Diploscapter pachys TaxID=2018661 RepID=A0A2A2LD98_9BILA|nr:hypothetical protein WR25_10208 [Diploscapter pachys]